jgi:hypothetical protein
MTIEIRPPLRYAREHGVTQAGADGRGEEVAQVRSPSR